MHPSVPRFVRVIPRSSLSSGQAHRHAPLPTPARSDIKSPSLIEVLWKRKEEQGLLYPSNIRLERPIPKKALKDVPSDIRQELLDLTKER